MPACLQLTPGKIHADSRTERILPAPRMAGRGGICGSRRVGPKDSRPELNRLMADGHQRRFDAVLVWKFDRLARSVSHLLRTLADRPLGIWPRMRDAPLLRPIDGEKAAYER